MTRWVWFAFRMGSVWFVPGVQDHRVQGALDRIKHSPQTRSFKQALIPAYTALALALRLNRPIQALLVLEGRGKGHDARECTVVRAVEPPQRNVHHGFDAYVQMGCAPGWGRASSARMVARGRDTWFKASNLGLLGVNFAKRRRVRSKRAPGWGRKCPARQPVQSGEVPRVRVCCCGGHRILALNKHYVIEIIYQPNALLARAIAEFRSLFPRLRFSTTRCKDISYRNWKLSTSPRVNPTRSYDETSTKSILVADELSPSHAIERLNPINLFWLLSKPTTQVFPPAHPVDSAAQFLVQRANLFTAPTCFQCSSQALVAACLKLMSLELDAPSNFTRPNRTNPGFTAYPRKASTAPVARIRLFEPRATSIALELPLWLSKSSERRELVLLNRVSNGPFDSYFLFNLGLLMSTWCWCSEVEIVVLWIQYLQIPRWFTCLGDFGKRWNDKTIVVRIQLMQQLVPFNSVVNRCRNYVCLNPGTFASDRPVLGRDYACCVGGKRTIPWFKSPTWYP
ncbi:hypothetical protein C8R46DRAFT_1023687 [Mycena filopes]|nr:hypothetical protein C8R46DRAFT_1023687 [Mycena filopes]